ncbi:hypothetical protein D3C80_1356530 [compost metagenome]
MSKCFSSCSTRPRLARVVGLTEITPQYSGMCLANSAVPIAVAVSMMSCLWAAISGRSTRVSVTASITDRLGRVWLDTWEIASPVTSASMCSSSARRLAARSIMRLSTTPMWLLSTFSRISPTTSSNGTLMNSTRCERPNFSHR